MAYVFRCKGTKKSKNNAPKVKFLLKLIQKCVRTDEIPLICHIPCRMMLPARKSNPAYRCTAEKNGMGMPEPAQSHTGRRKLQRRAAYCWQYATSSPEAQHCRLPCTGGRKKRHREESGKLCIRAASRVEKRR